MVLRSCIQSIQCISDLLVLRSCIRSIQCISDFLIFWQVFQETCNMANRQKICIQSIQTLSKLLSSGSCIHSIQCTTEALQETCNIANRKKIVSRVSKLKTKKETFEPQVAEFSKKTLFEIICRTGKKFVSRVS